MAQLVTHQYVQACLPKRDLTSHKYKNGFVTVFSGSIAYPGVARLCCQAAARVGAGGVYALLPESLWPIISTIPAEVIPRMIQEHGGVISIVSAIETFINTTERSTAVLLGSGIGRDVSLIKIIKSMLSATDLPCVIDGDGLFMLGQLGEEFLIGHSQKRWILTPHAGEWQQLVNCFDLDSKVTPQILAQKWGCTILLKGFPSYIYTANGRVYENTTGNPAATTAGCGDVLAGMIAGYLSQGLEPDQSACVGMFRAGEVADHLVAATNRHSLMASDILAHL